MLSLMVILSAYYLFTQDINGKDEVSDATNLNNSTVVDSMNGSADELASGDFSTLDDEYTISDADQQVLNQLKAEGYFAGSTIGDLMTKRENQLEEEENRIMAVLADTTNDTEATLEALNEMEELEAKYEKISQIEASLKETYEVALISEELNDKYKVVVTSDTLEKKQAAAIIDQVIAQLEVRPEQVYVEFVANP